MQGWWRPWVVYSAPVVAFASYALVESPQPRDAPAALTAMLLSGGFLVWFIIARGRWPVDAFLKGLAEEGEAPEVVRDEVGWFGGRRTRLRTSLGEWRVETENGKAVHVYVRSPGMRRKQRVHGNMRRLARECVVKLREGESWPRLTVP